MPIRDQIRKVKHLQNKYYICVLENPKDIMNIAATIRNVSAFGIEKLYVIGNNKIVEDFEASRSNKRLTGLSVGSNKWVYVERFDTTAECIKKLRDDKYIIAVTSSHIKGKENVNLYDKTFTQPKLAVWFGNESVGISDEAAEEADMCIQIPMGGVVESLNLGTSTGIILSYISYQRLGYIYENKKVKSKLLDKPWSEFINPHRG